MTTTPERTPAEELRAAVKLLREVADGTTRGPWVCHPTITRDDENDYAWTICRTICEGTGDGCEPDCGANVLTTGAEGCEEDNVSGADAAWIALAHPALAEPLAEWLEDTAGDFEAEHRTEPEMSNEFHALAVARVINGGAS